MKKLIFLLGVFSFIFTRCFANPQPASKSYENFPTSKMPQQMQIDWFSDYNSAVSAARSSTRPILILFTGTQWCPACVRLERDVLTKPEFANAVSNHLVFLKAEFPNYKAEAIKASPFNFLLERYKVDTFPTMIVINPDGYVLFSVHYQAGGVQTYVQEIISKLSKLRHSNS